MRQSGHWQLRTLIWIVTVLVVALAATTAAAPATVAIW